MGLVKELLNVVRSCEIRGRLRCSAASIGYRRRIRKGLVHSRRHAAVMERCQARKISTPQASDGGGEGARRGQMALAAISDRQMGAAGDAGAANIDADFRCPRP